MIREYILEMTKNREEIYKQLKTFAEAYHISKSGKVREDVDALAKEFLERESPIETKDSFMAYYMVRKEF